MPRFFWLAGELHLDLVAGPLKELQRLAKLRRLHEIHPLDPASTTSSARRWSGGFGVHATAPADPASTLPGGLRGRRISGTAASMTSQRIHVQRWRIPCALASGRERADGTPHGDEDLRPDAPPVLDSPCTTIPSSTSLKNEQDLEMILSTSSWPTLFY
ncbi:hypothetical protein EJB05_22409 [Eragrostis curvula]|uniref:Uncharacterized protein n=1 Tax=Eragrostis curvula TaxID=38414 RepID=A0A5J9V657_9POAL|nr:hypothetical protein EJB05_22409 [Eragrostis curvula]